jgi:hypothetical protein
MEQKVLVITKEACEAVTLAGRNIEKLYINTADAIKVRLFVCCLQRGRLAPSWARIVSSALRQPQMHCTASRQA